MTQHCEAVCENGLMRSLASTLIEEQAQIVVESENAPADVLTLLTQVYAGLSDEDIDAVEQIALDRACFFTLPPRSFYFANACNSAQDANA